MSTWTRAEILKKIRQVTGRLSSNEISDTELGDRLNKFYQYTFPAETKLERNHTYYEFLTSPNQPYYTAPDMYINFENPALIDMMKLDWNQDPTMFYGRNPMRVTTLTPWVGDGITANFTTTIADYSIYPGSLVITDNVEVFQDTNQTWTSTTINITGSLGGTATINYTTGVITVGFFTAPVSGQQVILSYIAFVPGKPGSVLYYNNQFVFYPVPDTAYRFRVKAYTKLDPLVLATDRPLLDQWGPCLAYGTARDLHVDYGEMDAYAEVSMLYKEQVRYVLNRTEQNLLNMRSLPDF